MCAMTTTHFSPTIDRAIRLQVQGDVGVAAGHRAAGWIASQVVARTSLGSKVGIWTGMSVADNVQSVANGTVDIAVMTPACAGPMAVAGVGPFAGTPFPNLRALGTLPQYDRLVLAIRSDLGIDSLAAAAERNVGLRVACPADHPDDLVGWAGHRLMELGGITTSDLESRGGGYVDFSEFPPQSFERNYPGRFPEAVKLGNADAVIQEAIMLPQWQQAAVDPGLRFISLDQGVLDAFRDAYGWPSAKLPAGRFPHQDEPFTTLEFSDFLLLCRDDMDGDVAYLIARALCESRFLFEMQYMHQPPNVSQITYPLDPRRMGQTTITLHPGAQAYYDTIV